MAEALLVQWYHSLPQLQNGDDADLWTSRMQEALRGFRRQIRKRYSEGTLQRLLSNPCPYTRRASVLALGLTGTYQSNAALARILHDEDELVSKTASDSLWEIWFRGVSEDAGLELQRALHLPDIAQALAALDEIIREWPDFAEAYNQRAILLFRRGEYPRSIADCERALKFNPYHFGAQAGIGECYSKMQKYTLALRAFKLAIEINPTLDHLTEMIEALEKVAAKEDVNDQ